MCIVVYTKIVDPISSSDTSYLEFGSMGGAQIRSAMLCTVNENITYTKGVVISGIAGMVEMYLSIRM
jgi:hypothetical protein